MSGDPSRLGRWLGLLSSGSENASVATVGSNRKNNHVRPRDARPLSLHHGSAPLRLRKRYSSVLVSLCVLVSLSFQLAGQQITGNIRGTVADPSGAVVQNATVIATQTETGLSRTATTQRDGTYLLLELPVGHY